VTAARTCTWCLSLLALLTFAAPLGAQESAFDCRGLSAAQEAQKATLFQTLHPYDVCDGTFAQCLAASPVEPLVKRHAADLCRLLKEGKESAEIQRLYSKRALTMLPGGPRVDIPVEPVTLAGDPQAPVTVAVYACVRCPFCSVMLPLLHKEVTEGSLKGRVKLHYRSFPLKDHAGSAEGGLAVLAAGRQGKFWPMLLKLYADFAVFKVEDLPGAAATLGLDGARFQADLASEETKKLLVATKQEGFRNKVASTPTLFIDGRRYQYENRFDVVLDVLQEAAGL
jgi:protein-disulfide isomerase